MHYCSLEQSVATLSGHSVCPLGTILRATVIVLGLFALPAVAQEGQPRDMQLKRSEAVESWPDGRKRFALIVGINDYQNADVTDLNGAANDARDLERALIQYAGFPQENVITLISDRTTPNQQIEYLPTKANIQERLSELLARARAKGKDSLVLIAFSGHGIVVPGQYGKEALLIPMDGFINRIEKTAIRLTEIKEEVERSGIEQVVVIVDACRRDPQGSKALGDNILTEAYTVGLDFQRRNSGIKAFVTLYATGINQRAYEYTEGSRMRGYFTSVFVEAISGAAANRQGEITLEGLLSFIERVVPTRVKDRNSKLEQIPFSIVEGYRANELVIALSGQRRNAPKDSPKDSPTANNTLRPPYPTVTAQGFTFSLKKCSLSEETVDCELLVTNSGSEKTIEFEVNSKAGSIDMIDSFGNRYQASEIIFKNKPHLYDLSFTSRRNSNDSLRIRFNNIPLTTLSMNSVNISWALGDNSDLLTMQPEITFPDVPLVGSGRRANPIPSGGEVNYRDLLLSSMWVDRESILGPTFYKYEPGGRVLSRSLRDKELRVSTTQTWYLTGNTLHVVYEYTLGTTRTRNEYTGVISKDKIEGTVKSITFGSDYSEHTSKWLLYKASQ